MRLRRPKGAHILKNKWIWVLKENEHRLIRFKARLVVLGCLQIWGLEFDVTFAPVVRIQTTFDFITSFLNAAEERVIYMEQPQGHVKRGYESWVCLLKEVSMDYGSLQRTGTAFCTWCSWSLASRVETRLVLLPIYVDDILLIGAEQDVNSIAEQLKDRFQMNELGSVNYLLGLQIGYDPEKLVIFQQTKYLQDILQKFRMGNAYPGSTPMTTDS
ncbi:Integrase, catalytic core protein, partial [Phytophthora megakarya]